MHHNGQLGIASGGDTRSGNLVQENEVAYNNYAGYDPGWQAGGMKWLFNTGLTVLGNNVHDNHGPGIWIDSRNSDVLIENNRIENNEGEGVIVEASADTVVRNNQIRGNGFVSDPVWVLGAGILNANSVNVSVYGNVLEDNFNGITATQRPRTGLSATYGVVNFQVHDNVITTKRGRGVTGISAIVADLSYYTSQRQSILEQHYDLGCRARPFVWDDPTGLSRLRLRHQGSVAPSR